MRIKIKKIHPYAQIPRYARKGDGGMDLTAVEDAIYVDHAGAKYIEYRTGLAFEIPEGFVGLLFPRSSVSNTALGLANSVGVIDPGYRGEVSFRFRAATPDGRIYAAGDRIGQILIIPRPEIEFEEVDELAPSERGTGGYGSTGV